MIFPRRRYAAGVNAFRYGIAWILISEALFAVMRVATRSGAAEVPGIEIGALRFLGGALVTWVIARVRGASLRVGDQRTAWMRSGFGTLNAAAVFYVLGSPRIAVGDAATLSAVGPLFVALLSLPLIREKVSRRVAWGGLLGFFGVALLVRPAFRTAGDLVVINLAGALCYAIAMLSLRRLGPRETPEGIAFHVSVVAGVAMTLASLPHLVRPSPAAWLPLGLSALAGGLGQLAMSRAYALDRAARMSAFAYVGVVLTYALEGLVWKRPPQAHQITGALLVSAAGVIVASPRRSVAGAVASREPDPSLAATVGASPGEPTALGAERHTAE